MWLLIHAGIKVSKRGPCCVVLPQPGEKGRVSGPAVPHHAAWRSLVCPGLPRGTSLQEQQNHQPCRFHIISSFQKYISNSKDNTVVRPSYLYDIGMCVVVRRHFLYSCNSPKLQLYNGFLNTTGMITKPWRRMICLIELSRVGFKFSLTWVTGELSHDAVIKWKQFLRFWPFVWGIHRSPVNSPHKGQWRRAWMFSLICAWINGWVNNIEAGDLRRHRAHCDVIEGPASNAMKGSRGHIQVPMCLP